MGRATSSWDCYQRLQLSYHTWEEERGRKKGRERGEEKGKGIGRKRE